MNDKSYNLFTSSNSLSGKPDPVKDCTVTNKTFTAIFVECKPGYDGGLQQSFIIEVFPVSAIDASSGQLATRSQQQQQREEELGEGDIVLDDGHTKKAAPPSPTPSSKASLTSPIARLENRHFPQFSVEGLAPGTAFGLSLIHI